MKKLLYAATIAATLSLAGNAGCASNGSRHAKTPTQKEQATKQWNAARAGVMASMAKSQYESGNFDQCQTTVTDAMRLNPESPELHLLQAKLGIEKGQLDVADKELQQVKTLAPQMAEADYLSGVVFQRWNKDEQALASYTAAFEKLPTEPAYLLARCEMLVALDRSPEALQVLEEKIITFDQNGPLRDALGQLYVGQGRYAEAVTVLRQAASMTPDDQLIREHLAMAYFFNKQHSEAGAIFEKLLKVEKNQSRGELWLAMGECQMQLGRTGNARTSFDRACQAMPSSPRAWTSHAKAAMQLGDQRRAELSLRKALSLESSAPDTHLLLGYLKLRQDKLPEALVEFRKANELDQGDTVSLCMIGYVFEKSGKTDRAMKYYAQALKMRPNDELATRLMATIDANERE